MLLPTNHRDRQVQAAPTQQVQPGHPAGLPAIPDIAQVHIKERQRWLKAEAPRRSAADWLGILSPYFILVVAIVGYAISAPHTSSVLDLLTPGVGWLAPVGIELYLYYAAFKRHELELRGEKLPPLLKRLRWLMFATAILTNFAGALDTVVSRVGLQNLSGEDIWNKFRSLPVTTQVALIMVVIMAFVVPIAMEVAGKGIADLVYSPRAAGLREQRWLEVERRQVYRAYYEDLRHRGVEAEQAKATAQAEVQAYFTYVRGPATSPSDRKLNAKPKKAENDSKLETVKAFIKANPDIERRSIRPLQKRLAEHGIKASVGTISLAWDTILKDEKPAESPAQQA